MKIKTIAVQVTQSGESLALYADLDDNENINNCYLELKTKAYKMLNKTPFKENDRSLKPVI